MRFNYSQIQLNVTLHESKTTPGRLLTMINNDILRRLRYALSLDDRKMIAIFKLGGLETTRDQIKNWVKKEEDPGFQLAKDIETSIFINGLIIEKRGTRDEPSPKPENQLTNNAVLRKLKIAFEMKDTDILELLETANFKVTKPELSALFRKAGHKNYRECKDQFLRNFLNGLQIKYRP